jgi:hypothetical protein
VDANQLFEYKGLGIQDRQAAPMGAEFTENRHGQIPFT